MLSEASLDAIEAAVADAERATSCEYIVVLAPASDRYDARVFKVGILVTLLAFALFFSVNEWLYGPPHAMWLLLEALSVGIVVTVALKRFDVLRRLVVPGAMRRERVDAAAAATFFEENVSLTRDRNAVLLYVSVFEGEVRMLPDVGVQQKVHDARLNEIQARLANAGDEDPTDLVCEAVRKLGHHCAECFPIRDDDENELPDRPQIRMP